MNSHQYPEVNESFTGAAQESSAASESANQSLYISYQYFYHHTPAEGHPVVLGQFNSLLMPIGKSSLDRMNKDTFDMIVVMASVAMQKHHQECLEADCFLDKIRLIINDQVEEVSCDIPYPNDLSCFSGSLHDYIRYYLSETNLDTDREPMKLKEFLANGSAPQGALALGQVRENKFV